MNNFLADLKKRFTGKRLVFLTIPYTAVCLAFFFLPHFETYESMIILAVVISYLAANWIWDIVDRKHNQNSDS
ncbi:hypothetical protein [Sporolactobacillus pectinivorans]|uniref:hypothetical protein n=1 Tax=Sporolactobacillus pectinivorans TaxID=1591408 RepID=UPI000C26761A|nr:hypothetical protein [Sporolactobacillus pectinivorans]